ncbi:MAG: glycosyltransferase 87 family protein [Actinomycetota bacterium]
MFKAQCLGAFNEKAFKNGCYSDLQPLYGIRLFSYASGAPERVFPYVEGRLEGSELVDGAIEYPVLTGVFMWASGSLVDDGDSYLRVSALLLAPFALLTAFFLAKMGGSRALLWAAAPALVLYAFHNWDLLVVAAAVTGFWFWSRGSPVLAAVMFGLGAGLKMYPIMFLAPLFLEHFMAGDRRMAVRSFAAGIGTLILVNLPFALINFDGWIATYTFHSQRTPNFDSIWYLGVPEWAPKDVNLASGALTLVTGLIVLAVGWYQGRKRGAYPFLQVSGALLAAFLLWNKVHSPQYTLWLLPFFVLLRVNVLWWVAYAAADLAVYIGIFRWFYDPEGPAWDVLVIGVWARAALLGALVGVFLLIEDRLVSREPRGALVKPPPEHAVS